MAENAAGAAGPVPLPASLELLAEEIETYHRELPRLLADGEAGRYALVKGGRVLGTWDTYRDAMQAGRRECGPDVPFLAHKIDARDLERLKPYLPARGPACPA